VEHVPSVIESPNATIAPDDVADETSIAFNQNIDVVVTEKGFAASCAVASPDPLAAR
jgi:hypothetical protein